MDISAASQFEIGKRVRKKSGSWWEGKVVGYYSTKQTPDGVAVQLEKPNGPVQIYPASALEIAVWQPHTLVTQEYADSYQWWEEFLVARTNAIDAMLLLGRTEEQITRQLSFSDIDHVSRIIASNNLRR